MSTPCHVATFNCKNLSTNNTPKLQNLCATILQSNADIICIQEINKLEVVQMLLDILGTDKYSAIFNTIPIDNAKVHEYMAFIYKIKIDCFTFNQSDKEKYVGSTNKLLIRAPVFARFIINSSCDLVIVSMHTNQKNPMYDCIRIKDIIRSIKIKNKCNNIIVLGDFNTDCADEHAFGKILKHGWKPCLPRNVFTNFDQTSQYDNIWYHPDSCKIKQPAKIWEAPVGSSVETYSDHLMVSCQIDIVGGMSPEAEFFYMSDMTSALNYKKFTWFTLSCCFNSKLECHSS